MSRLTFVADRGIFITSLKIYSRLDTRWCESILSGIIWCALIRYGQDWSISGDTMCHALVPLSDTIKYVPIAHDWVPVWQDYHDRGPRFGAILYVQIRPETFWYDYHKPMRSVVIGSIVVAMSFTRVITIWLNPDEYIRVDSPFVYLFMQ